MSCLRSPAAKMPLEDDDLLRDILLRLPPQPSSLPRASLVCKRWRSLASDPAFFRRFRRHHHRNLSLLGFFNGFCDLTFTPTLDTPNRVPPGRFSLQSGEGDRDHLRSLGCRHGLMLILNQTSNQMLVWDPVTGDQNCLAIPPEITTQWINGAVLRPAEEADHFQVVLVAADNKDRQHRRALACVYSSQTGLWGDLISTPLPSGILGRSHYPTILRYGRTAVLSGDSIYWMLGGNCDGILEFDLEKQSLGVIQVPAHMCMGEEENHTFWIMGAEGGGLGLLFPTCSNIGSTIQLWKRKADCDGVASWALGRTIELDNLLPLKPLSPTIVGFAENNDVVFLWTSGAAFMIHLESLQCKKLETEHRHHVHVHPFESVYKGGTGDEHDAADLLQYA